MLTTIAGIITGIAATVTGLVWVAKYLANKFETTPEQTDAEIDKANQDALNKAKETGRPS